MHCVHILQLLKAFILINVTTLIIKRCLYNDWFVTCCKAVQDVRAQITPIDCNSICFQVKPLLRGGPGALLLILCSPGPSESFLCDEIELGELLLIIGLNEGTVLPEMLHVLQENKNLPFFSSKRNSKLHSACNETSRRVWSPQAAFHHHLPLLPFLFLVEFPGFPKPILFSHSPFLLCCVGGKDRFTWCCHGNTCGMRDGDGRGAGWEGEMVGERKRRCRSPIGFLALAGQPPAVTPGLSAFISQFRTLCLSGGIRHAAPRAGREKGQTLSLVVSYAPSTMRIPFFHGNPLPTCSTPCPFPQTTYARHSPAQLHPRGLSWQHLISRQRTRQQPGNVQRFPRVTLCFLTIAKGIWVGRRK